MIGIKMARTTHRWMPGYDRLAGLLAAALALGVAELVAAVTGNVSLVVSVGNAVVDSTPGAIVKWAIELFGTRDKPILLTVIVLASLALGGAIGPIARRWPRASPIAFTAFGVVGALAALRDPMAQSLLSVLQAALAALAGWWSFGHLLRAATLTATAPHDQDTGTLPGRGLANRRRFLTFAGLTAGGAALSAVTGRLVLGPPVDVEAQRAAIDLPSSGTGSVTADSEGFPVPGQSTLITPNETFYRIDTALIVPRIDRERWALTVHGMVERPFQLTFAELLAMVSIEDAVTLACVSNKVGGNLVGNAVWTGIPLSTLLERAGIQSGADQVVGRSVDGFTAGFPTEVVFDGRQAMVAIGMNGEPLPADHGFPARLVIPGLYGYVSATKWLKEIELTSFGRFEAYWIPRGWSKFAPIKTQSRIDVPRFAQRVTSGPVAVAGVAWGGIRSIDRVEVRIAPITGGESGWAEARLGRRLNESTWRQWVYEWDAPVGTFNIEVRATDGDGETQTSDRSNPAPNGATGYHRIRVHVEEA